MSNGKKDLFCERSIDSTKRNNSVPSKNYCSFDNHDVGSGFFFYRPSDPESPTLINYEEHPHSNGVIQTYVEQTTNQLDSSRPTPLGQLTSELDLAPLGLAPLDLSPALNVRQCASTAVPSDCPAPSDRLLNDFPETFIDLSEFMGTELQHSFQDTKNKEVVDACIEKRKLFAYQDKINTDPNNINDLTNDVDSHLNHINDLNKDVDTNLKDINDLNNEVGTNPNDIDDLDNDVDTDLNDIAEVLRFQTENDFPPHAPCKDQEVTELLPSSLTDIDKFCFTYQTEPPASNICAQSATRSEHITSDEIQTGCFDKQDHDYMRPRTGKTKSKDLTEAQRYRQRRDRNNVASRRSREVRKSKNAKMAEEVADLETRNRDLKKTVENLEQLTKELKGFLVKRLKQN